MHSHLGHRVHCLQYIHFLVRLTYRKYPTFWHILVAVLEDLFPFHCLHSTSYTSEAFPPPLSSWTPSLHVVPSDSGLFQCLQYRAAASMSLESPGAKANLRAFHIAFGVKESLPVPPGKANACCLSQFLRLDRIWLVFKVKL